MMMEPQKTTATKTAEGAASLSTWHGIARNEIPWFPTVDSETCIHCGLCYLTCGRGVYEMPEGNQAAMVADPYRCMVGCSTCGTICPVGAISFPDPAIVQKAERAHKILKAVREELTAKKSKVEMEKARAKAAEEVSAISPQVEFEVAGDFGNKQFMLQLYEFVKDKECDVTHFTLENPTLKGTIGGKAPSHCRFRLVSETYDNIAEYAQGVHQLIQSCGLILTNERKV
jgi:NAD-dependent dihydropyrimidine dehydrogenase PreA subunit